MKQFILIRIIFIGIISLVLNSCRCPAESSFVYVSDLNIIHSGDINVGIGIDKPYWTDQLIICGTSFNKGLVIHPKAGGKIAYVEFLLPESRGRLLGLAGCAEDTGDEYHHKMRFRIFVDGDLLYARELIDAECQNLNLDLGQGRVLRIESDDGNDGNYFDHMAFGDLRIIY